MNEKKLNIIEDLLPTGKKHISFSEITDWIDCSWRHKLKHIEKIDLFENSEHLEFGTLMHDSIEHFLKTNEPFNFEKIKEQAKEKLLQFDKFKEDQKLLTTWIESTEVILSEFPDWLQKTFNNVEIVDAEHQLQETLEKKSNREFKGFIDGIFKCVNPKSGKIEYWICDYKTCENGWTTDKKNDPNKQMQMLLYKSFWARKTGTDPDLIHCAWILLKRTSKKEHIELVIVKSDEKQVNEALGTMYRMVSSLEKKIFIKNRNSCRFCPYLNTQHCN